MDDQLIKRATENIRDIVNHSIKYDPSQNRALVIFDTENGLTDILTKAYRSVLPDGEFIDFDQTENEEIIAKFDSLSAGDLVVMIQSKSFRINEYRIRINLFNRSLKVIEHMHLYRNLPETWPSYIDSLEYDQEWYGVMGPKLQNTLEGSQNLVIESNNKSENAALIINGKLEIPKLNTGDYSNTKNIGGTFPIGEVFTEAAALENMNGSFWVYACADANFEMVFPEIFRIDIEHGLVTSWSENAPEEFIEVMRRINDIERPIIREIGFGLNRAISKDMPLRDITAFERIIGVHLSLGEKHSVYKKPGISTHKSRFHVDLFVQTKRVLVNDKVIFENGEYT